MFGNRGTKGIQIAVTVFVFTFSILASNYLAPFAAQRTTLNPYNFLSWGAPGVFHEDLDKEGTNLKLEPWRLLGMQLPALASIKPQDWITIQSTQTDHQENPRPNVSFEGIVALYHTHTSEAFVPTCNEARSSDESQNVVKLGKVIADTLSSRGITVLHRSDCHDKAYNKSYVKSRKTAQDILKSEPNILLLLDVHRDGVGKTASVGRAVTTATVDGKATGQIMFVLSSAHGNWQKNNRVANDLHNIMENKYPGLSRGILIRLNSTYNQDLHPGAILVEIGGHWNTLDEAVRGARLFGEVLVEYCEGM